ncbi:MAG: metallophosphoesterase [Candidatus Thiodiazotropha sp.]
MSGIKNNIQWLHVSDFHIGKDGYGQNQLFKYILRHVQEKPKPDFVFVTGDIAQSGQEEQYDKFGKEFLQPLISIVGCQCQIFIVPGNHDVDRQKEKFVTRDAIRQRSSNFFDPDKTGQVDRQTIFSRFEAYADHDLLYLDNDNWLASSAANFTYSLTIKGCHVGILGLNTAWFAEDVDDKGQLTPGKPIVETGLEAISDAGLKIVLGHHPIDWFLPGDAQGIRALFGKHRVIYLHGHLHQNSSRFEEGAGHLFLNVQSGAAFQAREDDLWVNGLLWGEWNQMTQHLELEAYYWNKDNQEWINDMKAIPYAYRINDTTRFALPLGEFQAAALTTTNVTRTKVEKHFKAPEGWDLITQESLKRFDTNPDDTVILSYFDGRVPNFGLALCPKIPRRAIVKKMADRLNISNKIEHPTINMILGAGGEGKTTAFLQTIEALLQSGGHWEVVYRRGDNAKLGKKMVDDLPKDGRHWLIASDDADLIAEDVYRIAFGLQSEGRGDVHFLLSARHTDWRNTKTTLPQWERMSGYHEEELRGLEEEDAGQVVDAWTVYQEKGLGRLAGLSREDAVKQLVAETRSEKSREDGAFLGALLRLRFGEELKMHVKKLLDRLNEKRILPDNPNTLLQAFAYIAAMHAENKLFLSKLVLAKILGVAQSKLRSKVLYPLGEEAAADVAGEMVFTRHRAIAETALDILKNTLHYELELNELYMDLVITAEELSQKGHFILALESWRYLSDHFFKNNNTGLAIDIAQALVSADKTNSYFRVKLAQLFRKAGQPEQALRVFRDAPQPDDHRSFFTEWATGEGKENNYALEAWLSAAALADETARKPPNNKDAEICLVNFGISCHLLFENYNKNIFIQACGAATQLGFGLCNLTPKSQRLLSNNQKVAYANNFTDVSPTTAIKIIKKAAVAAFQQREAELPKWIPPAEELTFHRLAELLGIETDVLNTLKKHR